MMTRTGKIARLPHALREQLNRRLRDGERGKAVVQWLNALPEVQNVLTAEFAGRPMREQNLSEWRKQGYREWLASQAALEMLGEMVAEGEVLKNQLGESVTDKLTSWVIPHYVAAARAKVAAAKDPNEQWSVLRILCADLVALRRGDHYVERLRLEGERLEATRQLTQEQKELEFQEWLQRPDVKEKLQARPTRDRVIRRVMEIADHVLLGTPLEDFKYLDDEEVELPPDPAAMI